MSGSGEYSPDTDYLASPQEGGSLHTRGVAVDATLVDSKGRDVKMPTDFDDFTPAAMLQYVGKIRWCARHLRLLQWAMARAGFYGLRTEWWHFVVEGVAALSGRSMPVLRHRRGRLRPPRDRAAGPSARERCGRASRMIEALFRDLRQPEYVHALLNPLPIYGLAIATLALVIAPAAAESIRAGGCAGVGALVRIVGLAGRRLRRARLR